MMNGLLNLLALIVVFGLGLWLVNVFIPMPAIIKNLLNIVVLIVLVIYVLQFFEVINTILPMVKIIK